MHCASVIGCAAQLSSNGQQACSLACSAASEQDGFAAADPRRPGQVIQEPCKGTSSRAEQSHANCKKALMRLLIHALLNEIAALLSEHFITPYGHLMSEVCHDQYKKLVCTPCDPPSISCGFFLQHSRVWLNRKTCAALSQG